MSQHSFYLPPEDWGSQCVLSGQEARHLTQALRITAGQEVRLLDGAGREGIFMVEKAGKRDVALRLLSEHVHPRPASLPIMALAWSKATRRGFFMEKAVELGVHAIWLWQSDHSQGKVPADVKESWQGQMIAGIKQCGNPWLPEVHVLPGGVEELSRRAATADHKFLPWEQQENVPMLTPALAGQAGVSVYVIGPEGGFSSHEISALGGQGFMPVSLGSRVLRCETAAMLCLGLHWWASHLPVASATSPVLPTLPADAKPQGGAA